MQIKHRNEWIEIGDLESQRTYLAPNRPPVVIENPVRLLINDDDSHVIEDAEGRQTTVPSDWCVFSAKGAWGIHVVPEDSDSSIPGFADLDPAIEAIDFDFPGEFTFRVRGPVRMMEKGSGSLKIETNRREIVYIRSSWSRKSYLWKNGVAPNLKAFLSEKQAAGVQDLILSSDRATQFRQDGKLLLTHQGYATRDILDDFLIEHVGAEDFEHFMKVDNFDLMMRFPTVINGKSRRVSVAREAGMKYQVCIRLQQ